MRTIKSITILLITMLLCDLSSRAVHAAPAELLTLDDVRGLAQKGDALTLGDLDGFHGEDIGSGLYIMEYPLDGADCMMLVVGSTSPDAPVQYARLFKQGLVDQQPRAKNHELFVDIRTGDIDAYLMADTAGPLVEEYLDIIQSSPAWSSSTWNYISAHPEECEAIRALSYHALPALSAILEAQDVGLRGVLAGIFTDEILSQRLYSSFATTQTAAIEARAKAALMAYAGQTYDALTPDPISNLILTNADGKPVLSLRWQGNFSDQSTRTGTLIELYADRSLEIYALGMLEDRDAPVLMHSGVVTDEEYRAVERLLGDGGFLNLPEQIEVNVLDGIAVTLTASASQGEHTVSSYLPDGTPFSEIAEGIMALLGAHENLTGE